MKPQLLVLSSGASYFPLDLDRELKEREFYRLPDLDSFISSDRRSIPFLLILEVATNDDLERALNAYDWAETVDPRAPARFLFLAGKAVSFGERAAKLKGVEVAYLPINNRNLLFKLDLQVKLLEAAVGSGAEEAARRARAPTGFTAEMATRPGKSGRVMVVRGPREGHWVSHPAARGAKTRWRWIDEEGAGEDPAPDTGIKISWAAESDEEPIFEAAADGWILNGPSPDVQAYRGEQQIYSARKLLTAGEASAEKAAPESGARQEKASEKPSAPAKAASSSREEECANPAPEARIEAEGRLPTDKIEVNFSAAAKAAKEATTALPARPGAVPAPGGKLKAEAPSPAPKVSEVAAPGATAPAAKPGPALSASLKAAVEKNKNYLPAESEASAAGSVSAASREQAQADLREKGRVKQGELSSPAPARVEKAAPAAAAEEKVIKPKLSEEWEEKAARGRGEAAPEASGAPVPSGAGEIEGRAVAAASSAELPAPASQGAAAYTSAASPHAAGKALEERGAVNPAAELAREIISPPSAEASAAAKAAGTSPSAASTPATAARGPAPPAGLSDANKVRGEIRAGESRTHVDAGSPSAAESSARILAEKESEAAAIRLRARREQEEKTTIRGGPRKAEDAQTIKASEIAAPSPAPGLTRASFVLTLAELGDQNSTWQPGGAYRIYLSARHRYYGYRVAEELFPLWVYDGELAPEFLEEDKAWRFYDRRPEPYFSRESLPRSLSEELFRLLPSGSAAAAAAAAEAAGSQAVGSEGRGPANPSAEGAASTAGGDPAGPSPARGGLFRTIALFLRRILGS